MDTKKFLPGFTAEASLYRVAEHYLGVITVAANSNQVVPQFPRGLCNKAAYYCNRGYENWCEVLDTICLGS